MFNFSRRETQVAWRSNNRFQLFPGSENYVPELLSLVDSATESIVLEQYLVESGRFADTLIDALVRAARRDVQVFVLLDSFGAKGLESSDRERLSQAGIALAFFNPLFFARLRKSITRDHRKLLLVDQRVALTGGFCITDEFLDRWYDIALRIEGPVVNDWLALFVRLWSSPWVQGARNWRLSLAPPSDFAMKHALGGSAGRLTWSRGRRRQPLRRSLQHRIKRAQERVWIHTPYFLPSIGLLHQLQAAAHRGVDVRIIVAGKDHDHPTVQHAGRSYYGRLLRAGVRIYEYQRSFTHAKFCVVDSWCTLGSCNFDHWSLRWNLEANQEVEDVAFAEDVAELYRKNILDSDEITLKGWARRSLWQRFLQRILGSINKWAKFVR